MMKTLVSPESAALWKQRMFKYYTVIEVKFLSLGPICPFSYEKRFSESSAKSLKIPPISTKHKKELW